MGMRGGGGGLLLRIFDRVRDVPPSSSNHDPTSGQTMQKKIILLIMMYYSVSDTGILGNRESPSAPIRSSMQDVCPMTNRRS